MAFDFKHPWDLKYDGLNQAIQSFQSLVLITISIPMCISFNPSVADDPSGATVCTTME